MDCPSAGALVAEVIGDLLMSEIPGGQNGQAARRGVLTYVWIAAAVIAGAALLYVIAHDVIKPQAGPSLAGLAHGEMAKLTVSAGGAPAPDTPMMDPAGKPTTLKAVAKGVTVVNLWATWCPPCVKEMPTLAALQSAYPGRVSVIALSMDRDRDREKARDFIGMHAPLAFYQDPRSAFAFALSPSADGYPTTILYDRHGRERARLSGGADWNGKDARAVIDALLAEP
jgi:thiol-disulfide isomerase/thioredoxin